MTDSQTYAWILLSVPESGGKLQDLIAMADAINHAIPTHNELQRSLGWLKNQGLVVKKGRNILLTDRGVELLSRARSGHQTMMQTWERVTAELASLAGQEAPPDDVTVTEEKAAYDAYRKDFWKRFRSLRDGDA
jgi:hypothetical protein